MKIRLLIAFFSLGFVFSISTNVFSEGNCEGFIAPAKVFNIGDGLGIVAKTLKQHQAMHRASKFLKTPGGKAALNRFISDSTRQGVLSSHLAAGGSVESAYIAAYAGQTNLQVVSQQNAHGGYSWQAIEGSNRQSARVITQRLRKPEAVSTTTIERVSAGRFIPFGDRLMENANQAAQNAVAGFMKVKRGFSDAGLDSLTHEQLMLIFLERYHSEFATLHAGLRQAPVIFDTPVIDIKLARAPGIIFDHHGPFFDPKNPKLNTTMQVLDYIEKVMAGPKGRTDNLAALKRTFSVVTTDNLADGTWSIWIAQNLDRVVSDLALRQKIRLATEYEDFGVFATEFQQRAARLLTAGDASLQEAMELQQAILRGFDEVLDNYGVRFSDRFHLLAQKRQRKLMQDALNVIALALNDKNYKQSKLASFLDHQGQAVLAVEKGHEELKHVLLFAGMDAALLEAISNQVYFFNGNVIDATKYGTFASWSAPAQAHDKSIQLNVSPKDADKSVYILANPEGRQMPIDSLMDIGRAIQKLHLERSVEKGEITEAQRTATVAKIESQNFGRDALQFSFEGVYLTAAEIVNIVNQGLQPK